MNKLVNLLDSDTLDDVIGYTKFRHVVWTDSPYTEDYASINDMKYAEFWTGPSFNYNFNRFGFRTTNDIPASIDIGAYGCSFTMGVGLPEDWLWHKILAKNLNSTSLNFGIPGSSCKTACDLFLITSNNIQIKHAIILLPTYQRMQIASENIVNKRNFYNHYSLLPTTPNEFARVAGIDAEMLFKYTPDAELIKLLKNDIYLVDYVARTKNMKVYMSSWCSETYNIIKNCKLKNIVVLPLWQSENKEQADRDLARDKMHPGLEHHTQWANLIQEYIK
jgi:hypothetical protein